MNWQDLTSLLLIGNDQPSNCSYHSTNHLISHLIPGSNMVNVQNVDTNTTATLSSGGDQQSDAFNSPSSGSHDSDSKLADSSSSRCTRDEVHYTCQLCGNKYSALSSLRRHETTHTNDPKPFSCNLCNTKFTQASSLATHMKRKHEGRAKSRSCNFCTMKFEKQYEVEDHVLRVHEENVVKEDGQHFCDICHKGFVGHRYLVRHKKVHLEFKCKHCGKVYPKKDRLGLHLRQYHSSTTQNSILCPVCGVPNCIECQCIKMESHPEEWKHLKRGNKSYRKLACDICRERFHWNYELKNHKAAQHSDNLFHISCDICSLKFLGPSALEKHKLKIHYNEGEEHTETDQDINDGTFCTICRKKFSRKDVLRRHHSTMHSEGSRQRKPKGKVKALHNGKTDCTICGKKFCSVYDMRRHLTTHSNDPRPYCCDICGKLISQLSSFRNHKLTVHGVKDEKSLVLTCQFCCKQFMRKRQMNAHLRKHHGNGQIMSDRKVCSQVQELSSSTKYTGVPHSKNKSTEESNYLNKSNRILDLDETTKEENAESSDHFNDNYDDLLELLPSSEEELHGIPQEETLMTTCIDTSDFEDLKPDLLSTWLNKEPVQEVQPRKGTSKQSRKHCLICHICPSKEKFRTSNLYIRHLIEKHTKQCSVRLSRCQITEVKIEEYNTEQVQSKQILFYTSCAESFNSNDFQAICGGTESQLQGRITVSDHSCESNSFDEILNLNNPKTELQHVVEEREEDNFGNDFSFENDNFEVETLEICSAMPVALDEAQEVQQRKDMNEQSRKHCHIWDCAIAPSSTTAEHNQLFHSVSSVIKPKKLMFLPMLRSRYRNISIIPPSDDNLNVPWYMCCKCGKAFIYKQRASEHKRDCRNKGMRESSAVTTNMQQSGEAEGEGSSASPLVTNAMAALKQYFKEKRNQKVGNWTEFWELPAKEPEEQEPMCDPIKDSDKVKCKICERVVLQRSFSIHVKSHNDELLICPHCGLTFCNKYSYQSHVNVHTGEKPYKCRFCDKQFPSVHYRHYHEKVVHKKGNSGVFHCKSRDCVQRFNSYDSLRQHRLQAHGAGRAFTCHKCSEVFRFLQRFKEHLRACHPEVGGSTEKSLSCDQCKSVFETQNHLHDHIAWVHSTSRLGRKTSASGQPKTIGLLIQCAKCGKTVKGQNSLKRHMLVFHPKDGKKPKFFECKICRQSFSLIVTIRTHLRTKHTDVLPPELLQGNSVTLGSDKDGGEDDGRMTVNIEDYFTRLKKKSILETRKHSGLV